MTSCIHCPTPAEYSVPENLCRYHWADWFSYGQPSYRRIILRDLWVLDRGLPLAWLLEKILAPLDWLDGWLFRRAQKIS